MDNELMKKAAEILQAHMSDEEFTTLQDLLDGGESLYDYTVELHARAHPEMYEMTPGEISDEKERTEARRSL